MDITSYLLGKKSSGGGGGGNAKTINDLNGAISQYITHINNLPSTYEPLTQVSKTLYTPSVAYKHYAIYKNTGGKYRIAWFMSEVESYILGIRRSGSGGTLINLEGEQFFLNAYAGASTSLTYNSVSAKYYSNNEYTTLEECVLAIQNNQTEYTYSTSASYYRLPDENSIIYSNTAIWNLQSEEFVNVQRVSSNETIEATA